MTPAIAPGAGSAPPNLLRSLCRRLPPPHSIALRVRSKEAAEDIVKLMVALKPEQSGHFVDLKSKRVPYCLFSPYFPALLLLAIVIIQLIIFQINHYRNV